MPEKFERCETVMPNGDQCIFTGPHGDHIAKGSDGKMWIDRDQRGDWKPLDGTA